MGSTGTPLKRHKSVKFHVEESKSKPSIKITVSSDALAETILAKSISATTVTNNAGGGTAGGSLDEEEDGAFSNGLQQQKPALIQIVGNCCAAGASDGVSSSPPNGVLCNCANGDENRTRIALDDYTVLEFPNCIDFGIKDFLCCKDEIELDLSSDTDASFLEATPPHRFSDSELENTIEAMSITLDSTLNPYPNRNPFLVQSNPNNVPCEEDEDEEETTEESFIMDEEEGSSSASNNSGATMCGGIVDGDMMADLEQDDHPSIASSDLTSQKELPLQLSTESSSQINVDGEEDNHVSKESINVADEDGKAQPILEKPDFATTETKASDDGKAQHIKLDCDNEISDPNLSAEDDGDRSRPTGGNQSAPTSQQQRLVSRNILSHPKKHFKRQISLPASFFMSYLLEQNNKSNYSTQQQNSNNNHLQQHRDKFVKPNKLNRSNSCSKKNVTKIGNGILAELRLPLQSSKIEEYNGRKLISGSTEDLDYDDMNNSNSVSDHEPNEVNGDGDTTSSTGDDDDDPMYLGGGHGKWSWESRSDTLQEPHEDPHELEDEQQAFTSDVEKRSLILRHVRRLIRQDTTGNFAPADFSI